MATDPFGDISEDQILVVSERVRNLPGFPDFPPFEPAYDHMGALLTDAGLQAGIAYRTVVAPRVARLVAQWPDASTVSSFLRHVREEGLHEVLDWPDPDKPGRIRRLAELLEAENVETVADLNAWLGQPGSRTKLISLRGIKDKTADYIANLAGRPVAAVDRHIRTFVAGSGVDVESYDDVHRLLACVAAKLGLDLGALDRMIWQVVEGGWTPDRQFSSASPSDELEQQVRDLQEELRRVTRERDEALRTLDEIRRLLPGT